MPRPAKQIEPRNVGYYTLFSGAVGKAVLADLRAQFCGRSPFVTGDPYATHLNIGAQDVIRYIEEQINADQETKT